MDVLGTFATNGNMSFGWGSGRVEGEMCLGGSLKFES